MFLHEAYSCSMLFVTLKDEKNTQAAIALLEPKPNSSYKCPKCAKSFTAPGSLRRHMEVHTGQFSYYCEICRRGFNTQTNYSTQKRMHKGLKYNCLYCTKSYVFKQTYDYHQSVRTGQYRFNCDKCGKGFNEKRHLLVTLTISTKEIQLAVK